MKNKGLKSAAAGLMLATSVANAGIVYSGDADDTNNQLTTGANLSDAFAVDTNASSQIGRYFESGDSLFNIDLNGVTYSGDTGVLSIFDGFVGQNRAVFQISDIDALFGGDAIDNIAFNGVNVANDGLFTNNATWQDAVISFRNGTTQTLNELSLTFQQEVNKVPVPATIALFGLGVAGVAATRRKKVQPETLDM